MEISKNCTTNKNKAVMVNFTSLASCSVEDLTEKFELILALENIEERDNKLISFLDNLHAKQVSDETDPRLFDKVWERLSNTSLPVIVSTVGLEAIAQKSPQEIIKIMMLLKQLYMPRYRDKVSVIVSDTIELLLAKYPGKVRVVINGFQNLEYKMFMLSAINRNYARQGPNHGNRALSLGLLLSQCIQYYISTNSMPRLLYLLNQHANQYDKLGNIRSRIVGILQAQEQLSPFMDIIISSGANGIAEFSKLYKSQRLTSNQLTQRYLRGVLQNRHVKRRVEYP